MSYTIPQIPVTAVLPAADDYLEQGGVTFGSAKTLAQNLVYRVATIAALKALVVTNAVNGFPVYVQGYYSAGDGGGGLFRYSSGSVAADNLGTVIAPTAGAGRWLRSDSPRINVKEFGAKGDGVTNDYVSISNAIAASANGQPVFFPVSTGNYIVGTGLLIPSNTEIHGDSERSTNEDPNTKGVCIETAAAITILASAAVGANAFGIKIKNLSLKGNGLTTNGIRLGEANIARLCYGCTIENVSIRACFDGIRMNRSAYNEIKNCRLNGADLTASSGLVFYQAQGCEVVNTTISDYAYNIDLSGQGVNFYSCASNFAVSTTTQAVHLVRIADGYHHRFTNCVFENLCINTAGTGVEIYIYESAADLSHTTGNFFDGCTWNGVIASAAHVKIGLVANPSTCKTSFKNCWFSGLPTVNVNLVNALGTTFEDSYQITNYSGTENTRPTIAGADAQLRFYDVNGVQFSSTQVPSANPNTLDDYAEGTFVPAILLGGAAVGVTYGLQEASYTKIGRQVTVRGRINLTNKGSSVGALTITGLPYASASRVVAAFTADVLNAAIVVPLIAVVPAGASAFTVYKWAAGNLALALDTDLTNTSDLVFTCTYFV